MGTLLILSAVALAMQDQPPKAVQAWIDQAIDDLGDENSEKRDAAVRKLKHLVTYAAGALEKASASEDPEVHKTNSAS